MIKLFRKRGHGESFSACVVHLKLFSHLFGLWFYQKVKELCYSLQFFTETNVCSITSPLTQVASGPMGDCINETANVQEVFAKSSFKHIRDLGLEAYPFV